MIAHFNVACPNFFSDFFYHVHGFFKLSLGHGIYYGLGAYTSSILFLNLGISGLISETLDAEAIGRAERFGAVLKWDDREKVSIAVYENDGLYEYIFIEDARAFRAKLALARKHKVRGISVWRLGHEDPAVWKELGR